MLQIRIWSRTGFLCTRMIEKYQMLKCSIFLPFSLEIKTESNTHFSVDYHTKMLVCFLMSKLGRLLFT